MKIMKRDAFLALPEGVIFCSGPRWALNQWSIKGETFFDAASSQDLFSGAEAALEADSSIEMTWGEWVRDGGFASDDVFAVLEPGDIRKLIDVLQRAADTTKGTAL